MYSIQQSDYQECVFVPRNPAGDDLWQFSGQTEDQAWARLIQSLPVIPNNAKQNLSLRGFKIVEHDKS